MLDPQTQNFSKQHRTKSEGDSPEMKEDEVDSFISLWLWVFALKSKNKNFPSRICFKSHSNKYKINNAHTHAVSSFYSQRGMGVQWNLVLAVRRDHTYTGAVA